MTNDGLRNLAKLRSLEELVLGGNSIGDKGLVHLTGLTKLNYLILWGRNFTGKGFIHLRNLQSLRTVNLENDIENETLGHLAALPHLENLSLHNIRGISDRDMALLARSRSLRTLDIAGTQVTPQGVKHLAEVKTLENLALPMSSLTDEALVSVSRLTNLKVLQLQLPYYADPTFYNRHYTENGLAELDKLEKLEELGISGLAVTDDSVKHITKHAQLKKLRITSSPLSNAGLKELTTLKSLEKLSLAFTNVTLGGLTCLNELPQLKELGAQGIVDDGQPLDIGRCGKLETLYLFMAKGDTLEDHDLVCLENLTNLHSLQLDGSSVSDAGLAHLSGLRKLTHLSIGLRGVTDAGFDHLSGLKKLYSFYLRGDISDADLRRLKALQGLFLILVYSSQDISNDAMQDLKREIPGLIRIDVKRIQ